MNSVQVMGNLARDPQIRATKTGRAVASFSIAVNRNYTTPQGEQRELTDWINVVAWGNLAEAVGNQLKKGTRVFVEGRYSTRSYDTPDGQRRYVTEVVANMIALPIGMSSRALRAAKAIVSLKVILTSLVIPTMMRIFHSDFPVLEEI